MPKFQTARRIVFDLDGTLVDTAPDLAAAMNHVLMGLGRPVLLLEDVRHMVGQGARRLLELGLAASGGLKPGDPSFDVLLGRFLAHYEAHIAQDSRPFPGAVALLHSLMKRGIALGICTNKPQALAEALLDALALRPFFTSMVGGDVLPVRKPDPRHLEAALSPLGAGPALMIGDSAADAEAARAAGVPVLLARFGYSPDPVDDLAADACFDSFDALHELLGLSPGLRDD
ncbi:MAG: phosphoglycolate phosphatase [Rhodothalassiaceae bacterium]